MKKFFVFFLGLLLPVCSLAVHAENTVKAPSSDPMSEEAISYLLGEKSIKGLLAGKATKLLPNLIAT